MKRITYRGGQHKGLVVNSSAGSVEVDESGIATAEDAVADAFVTRYGWSYVDDTAAVAAAEARRAARLKKLGDEFLRLAGDGVIIDGKRVRFRIESDISPEPQPPAPPSSEPTPEPPPAPTAVNPPPQKPPKGR